VTGRVGFPAINIPHGVDRGIQAAIDAIRQRLAALEASVSTNNNTAKTSIFALQSAVASSTTSTSTTTTTTPSTTYKTVTSVLAGQALYEVSPGYVGLADSTILGQSYGIIGVAQANGGAGATIAVAISGQVANVPGAGFAFPYPVFCSSGGNLTQYPISGYPALQVGVALTATTMLVLPDQQLVSWQLNGGTVGYRRQVNFVIGAGLTVTAVDNPGANRVDIFLGQSVVVVPSVLSQDPWDWEEGSDDELMSTWQTMTGDQTVGHLQTPGG
jgi:hypothetical protein